MDAILVNFFDLEVARRYLPDILSGVVVTLELAVLVVVSGLVLGLLLAVIRAFQIKPINFVLVFFVDVFRAVPPLVIMILAYFALPYAGVQFSGFRRRRG